MITLRRWQTTDLTRIAELEVELFGVGAWTYGMLEEEMSTPSRKYLLAVDDATEPPAVVGYAGLWFDGEATQIMTIGVDPNYQRRGIGQMLLQSLIDQSIKLDAAEIFLEVAVDNEAAIQLYRSFGFLPLAIRKRYYPENRDAYTMRLTLA